MCPGVYPRARTSVADPGDFAETIAPGTCRAPASMVRRGLLLLLRSRDDDLDDLAAAGVGDEERAVQANGERDGLRQAGGELHEVGWRADIAGHGADHAAALAAADRGEESVRVDLRPQHVVEAQHGVDGDIARELDHPPGERGGQGVLTGAARPVSRHAVEPWLALGRAIHHREWLAGDDERTGVAHAGAGDKDLPVAIQPGHHALVAAG